ncbi:hypothetical protein BC834DRAFT_825410 [Gloeopeniophorella convolvens]|nr:hypothetical protein BC834DRAFT_825410 [Gloeopeniophorella convolvens]
MSPPRRRRLALAAGLVVGLVAGAAAQPAVPRFSDCFSGNASLKLNISTVYAQVTTSDSLGRHLNLTVLGTSPQVIQGTANGSSDLATLFATTEILTFNIRNNNSYFCSTLRPPSPLPASDNTSGLYCPIPAGPFAFSSYAHLGSSRELTTLQTRLRAVDPFSNELLCVDIATTPLDPGAVSSVYGHARLVFWTTIALAAAYWLIVAAARFASAWSRRAGWAGRGFWSRIENTGFVVASAVSGEGLSKSPALIRFVTPSMRDVFFHTQWCAAIAMVAVQWPEFIYPLLTQTAWATLSFNVTLAQGGDSAAKHWDPVAAPPFAPPAEFADQLSDPSAPIFVNASVPNTLFTLPPDAKSGLSSFAYAVGLRPQDLFGVCLVLFLGIIAGTIVLSVLVWALDSFVTWIVSTYFGSQGAQFGTRSPRYSATGKDVLDGVAGGPGADEDRSHSSHFLFRSSRFPQSARRGWIRLRLDMSSFHVSVLQGNLVRILMLFHLPVTIFSCYQLTLGRPAASVVSIALAALSFAAFSVVIPVLLVVRLFMTSTSKLYDETWTLLALGPLYNHYRHGSQLFACLFFATNLAHGLAIGCGQRSGIAQAVVILVVEVVSALVTSVWLPWGHGASMGLISFLFCVARIVVAVLLVILTPTVSIGSEAGQWVAYVILLILALVYLAFALLLACKFLEGLTRILGGVGFDRSRHTVDSGLIGVCSLLGCCGSSRRRAPRSRSRADSTLPSGAASGSQATLGLSIRKGSGTGTGSASGSAPPSVFRPEHALRPYREENDDDTGYIMGAWRPFPRPGYAPVASADAPPAPSPTHAQTGFSRVGGGRAHFDAPYAIAAAAAAAAQAEAGSGSGSAAGSRRSSTHAPPAPAHASAPSLALAPASAERTGLPPGAAPPHVRRKSQTAIIEHLPPSPAAPAASPNPAPSSFRRHSTLLDVASPVSDEEEGQQLQPRRRHWFQLRRPRRHSAGDESALAGDDAPVAPAPAPEEEGGQGRSFVVVRKRQSAQMLGASASGSGSGSGSGEAVGGGGEVATPARSFVVLRGKDNPPA